MFFTTKNQQLHESPMAAAFHRAEIHSSEEEERNAAELSLSAADGAEGELDCVVAMSAKHSLHKIKKRVSEIAAAYGLGMVEPAGHPRHKRAWFAGLQKLIDAKRAEAQKVLGRTNRTQPVGPKGKKLSTPKKNGTGKVAKPPQPKRRCVPDVSPFEAQEKFRFGSFGLVDYLKGAKITLEVHMGPKGKAVMSVLDATGVYERLVRPDRPFVFPRDVLDGEYRGRLQGELREWAEEVITVVHHLYAEWKEKNFQSCKKKGRRHGCHPYMRGRR